ncbi:MAG: hypothetical protein OEM38_05080 [Gammaproteobacteria bacterium]|nr:hypothetical protein [Gammaproteobacteria bacterium]
MKTLFIAWVVALLLYGVTSVVTADEISPGDFIEVWVGFSDGRVCIAVQDSVDFSEARAELWLVNNDEVKWLEDVKGYGCIDVQLAEDTQLHAITYDPRIRISVVADTANRTVLARL